MSDELPFTSHERELLDAIEREIREWYDNSMRCTQEIDKTNDLTQLNNLFNEVERNYKNIARRSQQRVEIIQIVKKRLGL